MIKFGFLHKLAKSFRLLAFLKFADHATMQRAFKAIEPLVSQEQLISLFDLWQDAIQDGIWSKLDDYGDDLLEKLADNLNEIDWNILAKNIDLIVNDAKNSVVEKETSPGFSEVKEKELLQQDFTFKGNVPQSKEERKKYDQRRLQMLSELKKRPDFKELVNKVQNEDLLGLTPLEINALRYYINRYITKSKEIERTKYNIEKIIKEFGISREEAKEKYKELKEFNSFKELTQDKIEEIKNKYNISEEDAKNLIDKHIEELTKGFENINIDKKIVPLTVLERNQLKYHENVYAKKLVNSGIPLEEAKNIAKSKFKEFKNKVRFDSKEVRGNKIKSFVSELKV